MKNSMVRTNALLKIGIIIAIVMVLQVPISLLHSLIMERSTSKEAARKEVTRGVGGAQIISGPFLLVSYPNQLPPMTEQPIATPLPTPNVLTAQPNRITRVPPSSDTPRLGLLHAQSVKTSGTVGAQKRTKGIFEFANYQSDLTVNAEFPLDAAKEYIAIGSGTAAVSLVVGVNDLEGITRHPTALCGDKSAEFIVSTQKIPGWRHVLKADITCPVEKTQRRLSVILNIPIQGTDSLCFVPEAHDVTVDLQSSWPNPSFIGTNLPQERSVTSNGFNAHWKVPSLNTIELETLDQRKLTNCSEDNYCRMSSFGVVFRAEVDDHRMVDRAVKYELLFVALTFLTIFLAEVIRNIRVHPVQYLLIGAALTLFYLLLLAFAEHLSFTIAYIISSAAITAMVAGYSHAVLKVTAVTRAVIGLVALLYAYLYMLLRQEDYALVSGAIGLFLILSAVMYTTRNIDWYTLTQSDSTTRNDGAESDSSHR